MPRVILHKRLKLGDKYVVAGSPAVLLSYGDLYEVIDPDNNNVLIAGMTEHFLHHLLDKGLLRIVEEQ